MLGKHRRVKEEKYPTYSELSLDMWRLLVAVCADGSIDTSARSIGWHLGKVRKQIRLRQLLTQLNITYTEREVTKRINMKLEQKRFRIYGYWYRVIMCLLHYDGTKKSKKLPKEVLNQDYKVLETVLTEMLLWDGTHGSGSVRSGSYLTSKLEEARLFIKIAKRVAKRWSIVKDINNSKVSFNKKPVIYYRCNLVMPNPTLSYLGVVDKETIAYLTKPR